MSDHMTEKVRYRLEHLCRFGCDQHVAGEWGEKQVWHVAQFKDEDEARLCALSSLENMANANPKSSYRLIREVVPVVQPWRTVVEVIERIIAARVAEAKAEGWDERGRIQSEFEGLRGKVHCHIPNNPYRTGTTEGDNS